jgi:hypothetical protein
LLVRIQPEANWFGSIPVTWVTVHSDDIGRPALYGEGLMRPLAVVLVDEAIEARLPLEDVRVGCLRRFLLSA